MMGAPWWLYCPSCGWFGERIDCGLGLSADENMLDVCPKCEHIITDALPDWARHLAEMMEQAADQRNVLLAACEAAMAQCGELCQGYDGWQTQMREAVARARGEL